MTIHDDERIALRQLANFTDAYGDEWGDECVAILHDRDAKAVMLRIGDLRALRALYRRVEQETC